MGQREGFQMTKVTWPRLVGLYVNPTPGPGISAYPSIAAAVAAAAGMPAGYAAVIILEPGSGHTIAAPITLPATRDWFFVAKGRSGAVTGPPGGDLCLTRINGAAIILATNAGGAVRRQLGFDGVYSENAITETENWRLWYRDTVVNCQVARTHGLLGAQTMVFHCSGNGNSLAITDTDQYLGAGPCGGDVVIVDSDLAYGIMDPADTPFKFLGWINVRVMRSRLTAFTFIMSPDEAGIFDFGGVRCDVAWEDAVASIASFGDDGSMHMYLDHGGLSTIRNYNSRIVLEEGSSGVDMDSDADPTPAGVPTIELESDVTRLPLNIAVGSPVIDRRTGSVMVCTGVGKFQAGAVTIYDLVHELSAVQAAQHDTGLSTLAGDFIRSTNVHVLETVTAVTATKIGLGNADPDLWGLTPSLVANGQWKKLDRGLDAAGTSLRLCACDNAGAAAGTIGGGKVRVRVEMERIVTLANV
jgi:hypothetical protein